MTGPGLETIGQQSLTAGWPGHRSRPVPHRPLVEVVASLDNATAAQAAAILVERGIWFAIEPGRAGRRAILVKAAIAAQVRSYLIGAEAIIKPWRQVA